MVQGYTFQFSAIFEKKSISTNNLKFLGQIWPYAVEGLSFYFLAICRVPENAQNLISRGVFGQKHVHI